MVETWEKSALILQIMGKMVVGEVSVKNLSGPISIAQVAGDSAQYGWRQFFGILAFLSISLGVLNLMPIPILDGGHVVFLLYELIFRKKPNEKMMEYMQMAGMIFLLSLMAYIIINDFVKLAN